MARVHLTVIDCGKKYQLVDFIIDSNGIIEPSVLPALHLPAGIDFTKGIIFNGKGPIWLYAHLAHLAHIAAWVATFDPRKGAVVVQSHVPEMQLGEIIPADEVIPFLPKPEPVNKKKEPAEKTGVKVIAFLGPPNSGKSVLLQRLREQLKEKIGNERFQREFFILRGCPDGEGDWFSEITEENGKLLRYKKNFDDELVDSVCGNLNELRKSKKIILVDCGGKIDKKNQGILNYCTDAVLVSHDQKMLPEWRGAVSASEVQILAEVESVLSDEYTILTNEPLSVRIGKLERHGTTRHVYDAVLQKILS